MVERKEYLAELVGWKDEQVIKVVTGIRRCGKSTLLAQYQGSSDINMGRGAIVIGLAAVIIGEVIFGKIFTNFGLTLLAVSIGAIIYYIVLQIVLQLGLNTNDLKLITALIVAVFLAIPYWKSKMFRRKVQPQSAKNGGNGHA